MSERWMWLVSLSAVALRCVLLTVMVLVFPLRGSAADRPQQADVVVYGATPGGCCAAIAAAREGATVVLLEPTDHVGGLNTGGLSFSDSNQTVRMTVMGLFHEWHSRIEQDYQARGISLPYSVAVKDQAKWTYEPHVAARVTRQMLREAGVTVFRQRVLQSVVKEGNHLKALITDKETFSGKVLVDATYEGDLMAAAGVSWTIGREGRADYGESLAGKQYPKSAMAIDGFAEDGHRLPLVTTTEAGDDSDGDSNVMVYSFRLCLTTNPDNRVPFPAPASYDPARFEVVRRLVQSGGTAGWDLYPLPGDKFDGNNSIGGQFSLGLVGGGNGWSEADAAGRVVIWEAHKQYTLELYRFLTTDPVVPEKVRRKYAALGLCRDEFPATGHFSPALYVREGRRMQGLYVVSQRDILEEPSKDDPIVVSSFPIDSHDCQRVARPDDVINEGTIFPVRMKDRRHGYPYHIPYRAIVPRPDECDNLLVPVALSCTHVAISSIRVEPTWMILGQSAGIAAALAAQTDRAVQQLPYSQLRKRLLSQKQVLDLPELKERPRPRGSIDPATLSGIVLDDRQAKFTGSWDHSQRFEPHIGRGYRHDGKKGDGRASAVFSFEVPQSGRYQLLMAYSAHPTRATQVPVVVRSGDWQTTLSVDQTKVVPAGQVLRQVGEVRLQAGTKSTITISNAGTDGFVIMDALQLLVIE